MKIFKLRSYFLLFIALAFAANFSLSFAKQEQSSNVFQFGDKACFIGDSITAGGSFSTAAMIYYVTRFPETKVNFYNVGISGDTSTGLLRRMDWDILPQTDKEKGITVLMIGMNDVERRAFETNKRKELGDEKFNERLQLVRSGYQKRLVEIVEKISNSNRKLVLFTPSIYDQTANLPSKNGVGINDELNAFGKIGVEIAKDKKNAIVVDMNGYMSGVNKEYQEKFGSDKTIIGKDRIHPKEVGGLVMLSKWLSDFNEPKLISTTEINLKTNSTKTFNCEISNLRIDKNKISFSSIEAALPYPLGKGFDDILQITKFDKIYNQQTLKITDIADGNYEIKIDGKKIRECTAKELSDGINLANDKNTPQYEQAKNVAILCHKFKIIYGRLRSAFIAERLFYRQFSKLDVNKRIEFAKEKLGAKKTTPYEKYACKVYVEHKPKESEYIKTLRELNESVYKEAKPKSHKFEIEKI